NAGEGTDTVRSSASFTLGANLENLVLTGGGQISGTGNSLDNTITGNVGANVLEGLAGNDTLDGSLGADTMSGGLGDDTYEVENASDVVVENAGEGTDTVRSRTDYSLGANVENLTLTGFAASHGTGNAAANVLTGNAGNNELDGAAGADTMKGAAGDDIYYVDDVADVVYEVAAEGDDTVNSSVTYTLGTDLENLSLTGSTAINGTGNAGANSLRGNSAANMLSGGGGDDTLEGGGGTDTLAGGLGNDVYILGDGDALVTEGTFEGLDTVHAGSTYTLTANVENLILTGESSIDGTGNDEANNLTGNSAANVLDGGVGADSMIGGTGDDVYVVDNASDWVAEYVSEGFDEVRSSIGITLAVNVESLTLTGTAGIDATGNAGHNVLRGNSGANKLDGGAGVDLAVAGDGADTLVNAADNGAMDGGSGNDTLTGGSESQLLAGGTGADTLNLGAGADIIAFNKGDGADIVTSAENATASQGDTLSLGKLNYSELRLARAGNNLLVKVAGTGDSMTFKDWYVSAAHRTVGTLQVVVDSASDYAPGGADALRNSKVKTFHFDQLVGSFDAALAANPALGDWTPPDAALTAASIASSNTQARGGYLASTYAHDGTLSDADAATSLGQLADSAFGTAAQDIAEGSAEMPASADAASTQPVREDSAQKGPQDGTDPTSPFVVGPTTPSSPFVTGPSNSEPDSPFVIGPSEPTSPFVTGPSSPIATEMPQPSPAETNPGEPPSPFVTGPYAVSALWDAVDAWSALQAASVTAAEAPTLDGNMLPDRLFALTGASGGLSEKALAFQQGVSRIENVAAMH
ncbi:MAG: hypothetical protein ABIR26_15495, partial [Ramlibacter sp.]